MTSPAAERTRRYRLRQRIGELVVSGVVDESTVAIFESCGYLAPHEVEDRQRIFEVMRDLAVRQAVNEPVTRDARPGDNAAIMAPTIKEGRAHAQTAR